MGEPDAYNYDAHHLQWPDYIISATIYWMNPRTFTDSTSAAQIPCLCGCRLGGPRLASPNWIARLRASANCPFWWGAVASETSRSNTAYPNFADLLPFKSQQLLIYHPYLLPPSSTTQGLDACQCSRDGKSNPWALVVFNNIPHWCTIPPTSLNTSPIMPCNALAEKGKHVKTGEGRCYKTELAQRLW